MCISEKSKIISNNLQHVAEHVLFVAFSKHKIDAGILSISGNNLKQIPHVPDENV
jgi:hypothetical protein